MGAQVDVSIRFVCDACGEELDVGQAGAPNTFNVKPCKGCKEDLGVGYNLGYTDGYEQGRADGEYDNRPGPPGGGDG